MKIFKIFFKVLISLAITYATIIPALPLYYKWFVPFPKLEEATVYTGILSVEGKISLSKNRCNNSLRYFVSDTDGKHEIYYGLPGCRETPYHYPREYYAKGKYWFEPTFGVIQSDDYLIIDEKTKQLGDKRFYISYESNKNDFENQFDYKHALIRATPFVFLLVYLFYSILRFFQIFKINK